MKESDQDFRDRQLETSISIAMQRWVYASSNADVAKAQDEIKALTGQRSQQQIARMERARGLRK